MLKRSFTLAAMLLIAAPCLSADLVDLSVFTTKGYVSYSVPGRWKVLGMQTKPPKTAASFQIENAADARTPDSTNVAVMTFETDSREAMAAFDELAAKLRVGTTRSKHGAWQVFTQEGSQSKTRYSVRDAFRDVSGARVMIRLAWPHLGRNPPQYDAQMEAAFYNLLDSVKGGLGKKPMREGEVVRRPIKQ
jgi:hypothetical protein